MLDDAQGEGDAMVWIADHALLRSIKILHHSTPQKKKTRLESVVS